MNKLKKKYYIILMNYLRKIKRNKLTHKLIKQCNNILVANEDNCNCFDYNNYPTNKIRECQLRNNSRRCNNYNKCKTIFSSYMSKSEPDYNPEEWSEPLIEGSHNCYTYFLDDKIKDVRNKCYSICKNNGYNNKRCLSNKKAVNGCSNLKPQPGNYADEHNIKGFKKNRYYTCKQMKKKILLDSFNKKKNKSNIFEIPFNKRCPSNYYKGGMTVQEGKTYHFYRQDRNSRYSHKQGTLRVENKDASGKPIYAPHLSDNDYNKNNSKGGITYDKWCGYYCIPRNYYLPTHAKGGAVK